MGVMGTLQIRRPVYTGLLCLLLALAAGFSALGFSAWSSVQSQLARAEGNYTTLAVQLPLDEETFRQKLAGGYLVQDNGDIHWNDGTITYGQDKVVQVIEAAPQVEKVYRSGLLSAHLPDCNGLASSTLDPSQYEFAYDAFTHAFSVLAVRCVSITDISERGYVEETPGRTIRHIGQINYQVEFEILGAPSLLAGHRDLTGERLVMFNPTPVDEDLKPPFAPGKTYLIRGFFQDYSIQEQWVAEGDEVKKAWAPYVDPEGILPELRFFCQADSFRMSTGAPLEGLDGLQCVESTLPDDPLTRYYTFPPNTLPFYAEYTGDWQDYLASPAGQVWREEIIPWTKVNQNSAAVVLTDNLYSSYNFNTGAASILEGRAFTQAEYDAGALVCLVSAGFAQYNGLAVGDEITMDFYDTEIARADVSVSGMMASTLDYYYQRLTLTPENRLDLTQTYTIVGIYTAPEFSLGQYNFTAETIFVPQASVPEGDRFAEPEVAYLNALALENGTAEEFEAYMAQNDMGGLYQYLDMGYGEAKSTLEAMAANALRLLILGVVVFCLAMGLYLYLQLRRAAAPAATMRLLGQPVGQVYRGLLGAVLAVGAAGIVLGVVLAAVLFRQVTALLLSASLSFRWQPAVGMALAQLLVLAAGAALACRLSAGKKLMGRK